MSVVVEILKRENILCKLKKISNNQKKKSKMYAVLINNHFSDKTVLYVRQKGSSLIFTGRNMHKISCKIYHT